MHTPNQLKSRILNSKEFDGETEFKKTKRLTRLHTGQPRKHCGRLLQVGFPRAPPCRGRARGFWSKRAGRATYFAAFFFG